MNNFKILDVTLRDGGCVNNFNFGSYYMTKILKSLEESKVDYIELGYIDEINGSLDNRTQFANEKCIYQNFLINKNKNVKYVAMIDYKKYDISKLEPRNKYGIDGIRLCFHKKDRFDIISSCKKIIELGYECFIQPMLTLRYSENELIELINLINNELCNCKAVYIVDSFGEMRTNELDNLIKIFDINLNKNIALGFHSHNNIQLSYSNAIHFLNCNINRQIIVDSSIMGMGKGAGNLNTELILEHLNLTKNTNYEMEPLLEIIDTVIKPLHSEYKWGYSVEYYLSSKNHCTPSYASHYYNKHMLSIRKVNALLSLLDDEKKISFDKEYAEEIYRKYNQKEKYDDSKTLIELKKVIENKDVLIIGPGKNINSNINKIITYSKNSTVISLNFDPNFINPNFILTTKEEVFNNLNKTNKNIIVASNITQKEQKNINIIEYKKWVVEYNDSIYDSSAVFALKLVHFLNCKKIYLAGLDGFSTNINSNYFTPSFRRDLNEKEVDKRNKFYKNFIKELMNQKDVIFITPSLYE